MAHEISRVNGIVEAMYANSPAWHKLGVVYDPNGTSAPTSDEAMRLAHLDWTVEKEPIYLGDGSQVPDQYAICRSDTGRSLGIVGNQYRIHQNADAFKFLDSLVDDGQMEYEAAFAMRDGARICLLARMPQIDFVTENDPLLRYVMFSTSHDGSGAIDICPTSVRVVCANTYGFAMNRSKSEGNYAGIRHSGDLDAKLNVAAGWLAQYNERFRAYADIAVELSKTKLHSFSDYLEAVFPSSDLTERQQKRRDEMVQKMHDAKAIEEDAVPEIGGTIWAAFNAVTRYVDHDMLARRRGDTEQHKAETHLMDVTGGWGAKTKQTALDVAMAIV